MAIVITGASTGIGFSLAEQLAGQGYTVFAGARKQEDLDRLGDAHANIRPVALDVCNPEQVNALVELLRNENIKVDALINNAGVAVIGPLEIQSDDDLQWQMETNLIGTARMIRSLLPFLRETKGRIINVSSTSGLVAWPFAGAYVASKYAIEGLSDVLRVELRRFGIETVLINPGAVATPLWEKTFSAVHEKLARQPDDIRKFYEADSKRSEDAVRKSVDKAVKPEVVVNTVLEALAAKKPKPRYLVGPSAKIQWWMRVLLSTQWFDKLKYKIVYGDN